MLPELWEGHRGIPRVALSSSPRAVTANPQTPTVPTLPPGCPRPGPAPRTGDLFVPALISERGEESGVQLAACQARQLTHSPWGVSEPGGPSKVSRSPSSALGCRFAGFQTSSLRAGKPSAGITEPLGWEDAPANHTASDGVFPPETSCAGAPDRAGTGHPLLPGTSREQRCHPVPTQR